MKVWHGMACAARYLLPYFVRSLVPVGKDGMEEESRVGDIPLVRGKIGWSHVLFSHHHLMNYALAILEKVSSLPPLHGSEVKIGYNVGALRLQNR